MASPLFNLPPRSSKAGDSTLIKKAGKLVSRPEIKVQGAGGLITQIQTAVALVNKHLGQHKDEYQCIRDEDVLIDYFDHIVANKYASLDTETDSTNPMLCTMAGMPIYTHGMPPAYVPMHHVSYVTGVEVPNQLSDEVVKKQLKRIEAGNNIFIDGFNSQFDQQVCWHWLGVKIHFSWCGFIGARLLNENEESNALKNLWAKYCNNGVKAGLTYGELFHSIPFTYIPIESATLYAANDGPVTTELNEFQRRYLDETSDLCKEMELEGVSFLVKNVEIPLIPVTAAMEDRGIGLDIPYQEKLSEKYHAKLIDAVNEVNKIVCMYEDEIIKYKARADAVKLDNPINIGSPKQLAVLLYEIMGIEQPSAKKGKGKSSGGTGEEVLSRIDHPIAKAILEYRGIEKLLGTYIDKMPKMVNPNTGRIHCNFKQNGTDTGRYSSDEPNMQNIPSKNKDIRPMFIPTDGYVLISADYSSQEPRMTAHLANDERMKQAFIDGKDIYMEIASIAFGVPYDECGEKFADGTLNPEGKVRRSRAKAIVLGVCYGKGVPAIAEDLKISVKLAQEIYDTIMKEFPGLPRLMQESERMAIEKGYVTTLFGRKRRLPDLQLPPYEFSYEGTSRPDFDPLAFDEDEPDGPPEELVAKYTRKLQGCRGWQQRAQVISQAKEEGLKIKDNGGFIAQAKRQCVNARIQGGAGDQIKIAMIKVHNDPVLQELDFHLVLQVHDELIAEAPRQNALKAADRFKHLMEIAIEDYLSVPSKCDVEIMERWYGKDITEQLEKEYGNA